MKLVIFLALYFLGAALTAGFAYRVSPDWCVADGHERGWCIRMRDEAPTYALSGIFWPLWWPAQAVVRWQ